MKLCAKIPAPSPRFLIVSYCILHIILDFYLKYTPTLPLSHLLTGTSPSMELLVIAGILVGSPNGTMFSYYVCTIDVILGVICLLTLPVISVAENATGHYLRLPFVSSFHSNFKFQVTSTAELFYVTILLGFISTLLILLFLALDLFKFYLLRRMCHADRVLANKLSQAQRV